MSLQVTEKFLQEEEREGFVVSPMMKRAWAAQMKLLSMMAEVFARHGLTWWMDYGSLIGTVRHRGYTPWDDDIDIAMPRVDYERGLKLLREELPSHCLVRKIEFSYLVPWAVVSNRAMMDIGEDPAQREITEAYYDFPYIVNVDVYPLDYIPRDPAAQEYFYKLMQVVDGTAYYYEDYEREGTLSGWLDNIEEGCGRRMPRDRNCRVDLYYLFDELAQAYADKKDESCGLAMVDEWACRGRPIRPLSCYEQTVWLPYEMIEVPVPAGYQEMLGIEYGNWSVPVRGATHDYPFYGEQERLRRRRQEIREMRQRSLDDRKIAFILCVYDRTALEICTRYLERLVIPEGVVTEILPVEGAPSICIGYNEAMRQSDARYKIYLHQDTLIVNRYFLINLLQLFRDHPDAGLVGMVGAPRLSDTGIMWRGKRVGNQLLPGEEPWEEEQISSDHPVSQVECIDGFLMATSVDLPWREDLLDGWDLYDAAQSMEFRREGYRILVPQQKCAWCLHDDGRVLSLLSYDRYREIFLKEYGPDIDQYACGPAEPVGATQEYAQGTQIGDKKKELEDRTTDAGYLRFLGELGKHREELTETAGQIRNAVDAALKSGDRKAFLAVSDLFTVEPGRTALVRFSELLKLQELIGAVKAEETLGIVSFVDGVGDYGSLHEKLLWTGQALRQIEFPESGEDEAEALLWLSEQAVSAYSAAAILYGIPSLHGHREQVLLRVAEDALDAGDLMRALQFISVIRDPSPETAALKGELTAALTAG